MCGDDQEVPKEWVPRGRLSLLLQVEAGLSKASSAVLLRGD
jgi:hypothetical protein